MGYSFYLNNRIQYYERCYQTIQDILSSIGGIINIVIFIMTIINNFLNTHIILKDLHCLLTLFNITIDNIDCVNKRNIINKKLKQIEKIKKNSCSSSKHISTENRIDKEKDEEDKDKDTITEETINSEKNEKNESPKITQVITSSSINNSKKEVTKINPSNTPIFGFCDYFLNKITFGKRHDYVEKYENFRKKIISVEHLMENYLKLNNLLQLEKRRSNRLSSKNNDNN